MLQREKLFEKLAIEKKLDQFKKSKLLEKQEQLRNRTFEYSKLLNELTQMRVANEQKKSELV